MALSRIKAAMVAFVQSGAGAITRTLEDKLREYRTARDYATLQAAVSAVAATGGIMRVPYGTWNIAATIAATITAPVTLVFEAGANINQTVDADLFSFTLGPNGCLSIEGHGELNSTYATDSTTSAAIRVVSGSTRARAVTIHGDIKITAVNGQWKYGLHFTDVQDPDISGLLIRGKTWTSQMVAIYGTAVNQPSVSWSISGVDVYECLYGVQFQCARAPGIEGIKLMDCDFVAVKHGLLFTNTAGYSPPQIELVACHVNSYDTCVSITKAIQVSIVGGLYYRDGTAGGTFFAFDGVQDVTIGSGVKTSIVNPALDVPCAIFTAVSQPCAFVRLDGVHYWANGRSSPVFTFLGNMQNVSIGGSNTKDTNGAWISYDGTDLRPFRLSQDIQINSADYGYTVMTNCQYRPDGYVDVGSALWGNVNIVGIASDQLVKGLWFRRQGVLYRVKSDVNNTVMQHNADMNLRDGTNMALTPGDTIDLYSEVSLLRERARRGHTFPTPSTST